jgi:hypothetical protein
LELINGIGKSGVNRMSEFKAIKIGSNKIMSKKLILDIDDKTFAWLEVLVVGLAKENLTSEEYIAKISEMSRKDKNDFGNGVKNILVDIACSLADGVKRSDSWERTCLSSLTNCQGTYVSGTFDDCIKEEAKTRGFLVENENNR